MKKVRFVAKRTLYIERNSFMKGGDGYEELRAKERGKQTKGDRKKGKEKANKKKNELRKKQRNIMSDN